VRLPDNITEWRLTAIAHTADTKIGYARAKVKAAKDLMARLRLPMWLVEGDRTEINAIREQRHRPAARGGGGTAHA
jgi:uncharacterized protein YfaS (alpha-2-macroglobulin family)